MTGPAWIASLTASQGPGTHKLDGRLGSPTPQTMGPPAPPNALGRPAAWGDSPAQGGTTNGPESGSGVGSVQPEAIASMYRQGGINPARPMPASISGLYKPVKSIPSQSGQPKPGGGGSMGPF